MGLLERGRAEERTETGGGGAQDETKKERMPCGEENDSGWVQWRKASLSTAQAQAPGVFTSEGWPAVR